MRNCDVALKYLYKPNPTLLKPAVKITLIGVIVLVIGIAFIWPRLSSDSDQSSTQQTRVNSGTITVDVFLTEAESFSNIVRTTGNVRSDEEIYLQMESSGRIVQIGFDEGAYVSEGTLLAKINSDELQAQKRRVEAQINLAKIREERQKNLLERQAISQEDYDIALNELITLEAELDNIIAQLDRRELRAPFSGRIGLRNVSPGAMVNSNDVIASLQKLDQVKIEFTVPERHRQSIDIGSEVVFRIQGSDERYNAKVYALEPRIDQGTRTVRLRARAENPNQRILPGAFANVDIALREIPDAILIPSESLVPEMTGFKVYVYEDGKVSSREVQIGTRTDRRVLITEGLSSGDTVLTTGLLQVRDGMEVKIGETKRSGDL